MKTVRCSVCGNVLPECICANKFLENHYVKRLVKMFRYKLPLDRTQLVPSNELIYNIKRIDRRDLIDFVADELCDVIKNNIADWHEFTVTNVPRSKNRVIKYGHDHSQKLAKAIAKKLDVGYSELIVSKQRKAQKKTHGEDRMKNPRFYCKKRAKLKSNKVLLVDDIVTTGASMGFCGMLIRGLGAKKIVGVSMAIAYKEQGIVFQ